MLNIVDFFQSGWNLIRGTRAQGVEVESQENSETPEDFIGTRVFDVVTKRKGTLDAFGYSPYGETYRDEESIRQPLMCAYIVGEGWADWLPCDDLELANQTAKAAY